MTDGSKKYWFPAKRYGWGWGMPSAWQGWVVLVAYLTVVVFIFRVLRQPLYASACYIGLATGALLVVCWCKGEPPRWRWGKDRRH
nr:hypothetical protein [Pandoraea thiooxydans]